MSSIHPSWEKVGGAPLEIMQGMHDDVLESIQNACKTRLKVRFRKGSRHTLVNTKRVEFDGLVVEVVKPNAKTISCVVVETGEPLNVPPRMLEAVV